MVATQDKTLSRTAPLGVKLVLALGVAGVFAPYSWQNLFLLALPICAWILRPRGVSISSPGIWGYSQILLWIWTLASLGWSHNQSEGITEVLSKAQWLVWPLSFMALQPWMADQRRWFARCIWMSAILVAMICVSDVLLRSSSPSSWFQDLVYENLARASGLHPIYLSMWILLAVVAYAQDQILATPVKVDLPSPSSIPKAYLRHLTYVLFTVVMVTQLSSRMAMLTGLAMIGAFVLILIRLRKFRWWMTGGLALLVLLPWLLIQANSVNRSRVSEMVDLQADHTSNRWGGRSLRVAKWKNTLECYTANPILGTGAGDFQNNLNKVYRRNQLETGYNNQFNSHNQYLQTLATLGPLGLFLLLLGFLYGLWCAWNDQNWEALMVFVIILSSMLTESMLERQKGLYIVGLLGNGYFWGMLHRGKSYSQDNYQEPGIHAA
jgi:O-antigen ligase